MNLFKRFAIAFAVIGGILAAQMPAQHAFTLNGPALADHHTSEAVKKKQKRKAKRAIRRKATKKKNTVRRTARDSRATLQASLDTKLKEIRRKGQVTSELGPTWRADQEEAAYAEFGREVARVNTEEDQSIKDIDAQMKRDLKKVDTQGSA